MLRKTIVLFMLLMILVMVFPTATVANDGVQIIRPWYGRPVFNVTTSDYVWVRTGWMAYTPGLVQFYISKVHQELYVGGTLRVVSPVANQYWGPITRNSGTCDPLLGCWNPQLPLSASYWMYPLGKLAAGEYEVLYHNWVDGPLTDLGDYDGDGHPDIRRDFEGSLSAKIIVE